ncbi:MAG: OmpH family outer membrane protein [Planctomycetaceae bacterium]|jgi:Skp family chaperone for outer membrane proteins|nr:OmpH family outer membrane protein [Planctomycetaceae bacterium]
MQRTNDMTASPRALRLDLVVAIAFLAALAGWALRPASAPEQAPSRVATVDLEKTFNSLSSYADMLAKAKAMSAELETKLKASESQLKDLEAELESFAPGSDAQAAAMAKLQAAAGEFTALQKFAAAKVEAEKARALRETYFAIKDAARRLAEKEGLDYILLNDSLPEMDPSSAQRTLSQISMRKFIFATPASDVTEKLIGFMNGESKGGTGG